MESRVKWLVFLVSCAALVLALENLELRSGSAPGTTTAPSRKSPAPEAGQSASFIMDFTNHVHSSVCCSIDISVFEVPCCNNLTLCLGLATASFEEAPGVLVGL